MDNHSTMNVDEESGYLGLYIGSMFSGKTSRLQQLHRQYAYCGVPTLVINYIEDSRYDEATNMATHDKIMIPCVAAHMLSEINSFDAEPSDAFKSAKVILINEGQFYPDVVEWVTKAISPPYNKVVHVCGLDGDFRTEKFGNFLDLVPKSDKVEKLTAICARCKTKPGIFSHRLTGETAQKVIGADCYQPLCRLCHWNANK